MARPSKPVKVIAMDGKSHITKKEVRYRETSEESLLTGIEIQERAEVKANKRAHKEFLRVRRLLAAIDKNDDLYGSAVNRYCLLAAECAEFAETREDLMEHLRLLECKSAEMDAGEYLHLYDSLMRRLTEIDRRMDAKRKSMFDIEKENVMTIASALRSIPKKPEKKKNALQEALSG